MYRKYHGTSVCIVTENTSENESYCFLYKTHSITFKLRAVLYFIQYYNFIKVLSPYYLLSDSALRHGYRFEPAKAMGKLAKLAANQCVIE